MIRGTTPDYILTIEDWDLTDKTVFVTIRQGGTQLTKSGAELSIAANAGGSTVAFSLTQWDTLRLRVGTAEVQVRFIDSAGVAYATEIASITVNRVLLERVIAYDAENPTQG